MKNIIAYYYNLYSYDIHQYKDIYRFTVAGNNYALAPCNAQELKRIYDISSTLIQNNIYIHQILPTNSNGMYITYNNKNYVLLKYHSNMDRKIQLCDLTKFNREVEYLKFEEAEKINWGSLWGNKIDYFEYQVNQFGKKYPKIRESISYYIGLVETGISLYINKETNIDGKVSISHKRIGRNSTLYDLYNPLNLIVDYKVRDAAEYFKDLFVEKENIFEDIIKYFYDEHLQLNDCYNFFIRMFYPSFYFDVYEQIMNDEIDEIKLQQIIDKTPSYEELLKKLYFYLSKYMGMPDIEWLKKI